MVQTNMNFVYGKKNLMQEGNATPLNPIYSSLVKSPFMSSYVISVPLKWDELNN